MNRTDVLIVGGGVIGLTTAYFLARKGLTVKVLDRGTLGAEASWAGAGIIPPGDSSGVTSTMDRLRALSSEMFPTLTRELEEITGSPTGYEVCGGVEFLDHFEEPLAQMWENEGIAVEPLEEGDFRSRFPGVEPLTAKPYYLPKMAQVRNPWLIRGLIGACMVNRVQVRPRLGFAMFKVEDERIHGVRLTNWETLTADRYLIAAGAWSGQLLADLNVHVQVKPVRGQMVLFKLPQRQFTPILLHGKRYLVPRQDGRVLAGATEEYDAGFNKHPTEEGVRGLIRFAESVYPGLEGAEIETTWAGLRPHTLDGMPFMGRVPGYDNLFIAAGHFRSGIQLSPATGLVMSELIRGEPTSVPIDELRVDRELNTGYSPAFRS